MIQSESKKDTALLLTAYAKRCHKLGVAPKLFSIRGDAKKVCGLLTLPKLLMFVCSHVMSILVLMLPLLSFSVVVIPCHRSLSILPIHCTLIC